MPIQFAQSIIQRLHLQQKYKTLLSQQKITLPNIPISHINTIICKHAIKCDPLALLHVPPSLLTERMCIQAFTRKPHLIIFQHIPHKWLTPSMCIQIVTQDGLALQYIPSQFKTTTICIQAVTQNGLALQYIPSPLKTATICILASKNTIHSIKYIPPSYLTAEMCIALSTPILYPHKIYPPLVSLLPQPSPSLSFKTNGII